MSWVSDIGALSASAQRELAHLHEMPLPKGAVLFRPGDRPQGFLIVLSGRVEVFLTGASGREILLYAVGPGQSCVQTTLGLTGGENYSGEALVAEDSRAVMIPAALFERLMDQEPGFRRFVLRAFGRRMADVTHLLERVAFGRIEARLAAALLELAQGNVVAATQAELAARIGSAREVVSRRLEAFQRQGWVETDRGQVRLTDALALRGVAATV
ncbi:Crp/Fnr family transcriptional regulator [Pseudogemmobacter blasticus]|uniref:Crp/Fnr family transcriptional regulator n=1 Tax=Fuscovulum blasticum DSM 2131 TaxID=1188250 RepID=A0A2T4J5K0_FUSBL|nr:Crp/Fnr family transcriptional regulator [Fuscovulum blasticum]PTE13147.1 Crp/Fnr family transcriptional regulator [Fuscovulum blasticum DSM 2131]